MARVTGIGGIFLRAHDPKALAAWYAKHLGIKLNEWGRREISVVRRSPAHHRLYCLVDLPRQHGILWPGNSHRSPVRHGQLPRRRP